VLAELRRLYAGGSDDLVVVDDATIERDWGWVFFYNTARYVETGDRMHMLFGNAPFIVNRHTGEVRGTGTARSIEHYIKKYERELRTRRGVLAKIRALLPRGLRR
jgi:Immunity protein 35